MNKKLVIAIVAVALIVIAVVAIVAYVFLSRAFKPPVDISGVSPSPNLTTEQLLPEALINKPLTSNYTTTKYLDGTPIYYTTAYYDEVIVHIAKAPSYADASETLNALYDAYEFARSTTKTSNWFTAKGEGYSAFFWKSGVWVFGVEAENSDVRDQVATEFVQHLRGL